MRLGLPIHNMLTKNVRSGNSLILDKTRVRPIYPPHPRGFPSRHRPRYPRPGFQSESGLDSPCQSSAEDKSGRGETAARDVLNFQHISEGRGSWGVISSSSHSPATGYLPLAAILPPLATTSAGHFSCPGAELASFWLH